MSFLGLLLGATLGALALVVWFKWHKRMTGGDSAGSGGKQEKAQAESLEAFIAAYRRGDVPANAPAAPAAPARPPGSGTVGAIPVANMPAPAMAPAAAETVAKREAFLTGAGKLVYLACRSGLRDHHCFAQVRLQSLCTGKLDPALQSACVDLLVCNAAMAIVAAIDIAGPEPAASDAAKAECLRSLGIRHLRLSPKSLPKPEDIRTLLYRM
jgi:hypothetical protein